MDRRQAAARCLVVGFEGTTLPAETRRLLAEGVGGIILFRRNVESLGQLQALIAEARAAAPGPLLVMVDEEGGRVSRLRDQVPVLPPLRTWPGAEAADRAARGMARLLRALGFDLDLAPVVDVDTNPDNPVIGDRAFSSDPEVVAERAVAFIRAMEGEGLGACAKHFPGHGDTRTDSHLELPVLDHPLERLQDVELKPFRAAVEARVASVMTAHVLFQALDRSLPATMSPAVMDLLRRDLGYDGWVLSDDLEMGAVADHFAPGEAARWALAAGTDALLVCHRPDRQHHALEGLEAALRAEKLPEAAMAAALRRREAVVTRFPPQGPRPDLGETLAAWTRLVDGWGERLATGPDPTGDR